MAPLEYHQFYMNMTYLRFLKCSTDYYFQMTQVYR